MGVFTVHLKGSPDDPAALESVVLVREGFNLAACLFGPLWLIARRCWIALLGWFAAQALVIALAALLPMHRSGPIWLEILIALFLGLEAGQIRRGALRRERYATMGLVEGRSRLDAERRWYASLASTEAPIADAPAPGPVGPSPAMVGMFPFSGGRA